MNIITVDNIYDKNLEKKLLSLRKNYLIRLVVDECTQDYLDAYHMLCRYGEVMPQLIDSYRESVMEDSIEFAERMLWFKKYFPKDVFIETSNEMNDTNWTTRYAWERTQMANEYFKDYRQMITLFVQPGFTQHWKNNKLKYGEVWLSFYPVNMNNMNIIEKLIPEVGAKGISECGVDNFGSYLRKSFYKRPFMKWAVNSGVPVGWWNWQSDYKMWNEENA